MVVIAHSTPADSAHVMRRLRAAIPFGRLRLLRTAPLPKGSGLIFRIRDSTTFDHDRLNLSLLGATRFSRAWGIVASLRNEVKSANTTAPASAQIWLRLPWRDLDDDVYRSFFVRTTAYSASYTPRYINGNTACNLTVGDVVSGVLEKPASDRNSAALSAWDFGRMGEFPAYNVS